MRCPACGGHLRFPHKQGELASREVIVRHRRCTECGKSYRTYEHAGVCMLAESKFTKPGPKARL